MRQEFKPLCSGFIQQNGTPAGTNPAKFMNRVASAITDGAGAWTIVSDEPFLEEDVILILTPGFASNAGSKGISFGVSSMATPGTMLFVTYRNDDGTAVAVGFYFAVWRRSQFSWD